MKSLALISLSVLSLSACSHTPAPEENAFAGSTHSMHAAMDMPSSGNVDIDFARGMVAHHQGAIDMAQTELAKGRDPELRALSEKIVATQSAEIAQMNDWLARHGAAATMQPRRD